MGRLKNEYKSFLDDIEKNIKNKEDLEYIKGRFASFLDVMLEQMDYIMDYKQEEIEKLESTQKDLDERLQKMQQVLDNIEKDIYAEEGFDFEIVCPYCNYEFIIDVDENRTEVQCPECSNIIELDWSGDPDKDEEGSGCSGHCSGCSGCEDEQGNEDDM
jgi:DNA repair exonuclease SbcCD ATPase subunit